MFKVNSSADHPMEGVFYIRGTLVVNASQLRALLGPGFETLHDLDLARCVLNAYVVSWKDHKVLDIKVVLS